MHYLRGNRADLIYGGNKGVASYVSAENSLEPGCGYGVPAYVLCPQTGGSPSSDLVATRNTYYDLSGNEPLMLKYEFGDIYFKDWQSYYGYDEESVNESPSDEILKKVELN